MSVFLTARTLDGQVVEFGIDQFATSGGHYWVQDKALGIVEIDPETVRCRSKESRQLAAKALALLRAINDWFGENPEAAPHEPPWAKDFYALMEKLGELERPTSSHAWSRTRTVSSKEGSVTVSHSTGSSGCSTSNTTKKE